MQVVFKLSHHPVQPFAPEAVEPFAFPEAFHQMWADCIIAADERASEPMLFQDFISELGLPVSFRKMGLTDKSFFKAAAHSTNIKQGCCRQLTEGEIFDILQECW